MGRPFFYLYLNTCIMLEFLYDNALELAVAALAFLKVVANLTRTDVDNKVFAFLDYAIDFVVPPRKKDKG